MANNEHPDEVKSMTIYEDYVIEKFEKVRQ